MIVMGRKIIAIIKPFIHKQDVYVFEDGAKINAEEIPLDELKESLEDLANRYEAAQIDIAGSRQFAKKIQKQLQEDNTKFTKHVEINVI